MGTEKLKIGSNKKYKDNYNEISWGGKELEDDTHKKYEDIQTFTAPKSGIYSLMWGKESKTYFIPEKTTIVYRKWWEIWKKKSWVETTLDWSKKEEIK